MLASGRLQCAAMAFLLAAGQPASTAQGTLVSALKPCQRAIAKSAQKYLRIVLKAKQRCKNANLMAPNTCSAPDSAKLIQAENKLRERIEGRCGSLSAASIQQPNPLGLGFPGACPDPDGGEFTVGDIEDCMITRHSAKADDLLEIQYGSAPYPFSRSLRRCQVALAKGALGFLLRSLNVLERRCRSQIDKGRLMLNPADCPLEPKTRETIDGAAGRFRAQVARKCDDGIVAALQVCSPPAGSAEEALNCLIQAHEEAAEALINVEHPSLPQCGDDAVNTPREECDGSDDSTCRGLCGAPDSYFPCLCTDVPRMFNRYSARADLDSGWTGTTHDGRAVDGGGYFATISHCGELEPNVCLTGPACLTTPQRCRTDADCPGSDTCQRSVVDAMPRCADDLQEVCGVCGGGDRAGQLCAQAADCPGDTCLSCSHGVECVKSFNGFPTPIVGGGTAVCLANTFVDDIAGTLNLVSGESQEFFHQAVMLYLGKSAAMPCPVCGGFCASAGGLAGLCKSDSDCPASDMCVLSHICNDGPNKGKPCGPDPPRGGITIGFGNTSADCPPSTGQNISGSGLDIVCEPFSTGVEGITPSVEVMSISV